MVEAELLRDASLTAKEACHGARCSGRRDATDADEDVERGR